MCTNGHFSGKRILVLEGLHQPPNWKDDKTREVESCPQFPHCWQRQVDFQTSTLSSTASCLSVRSLVWHQEGTWSQRWCRASLTNNESETLWGLMAQWTACDLFSVLTLKVFITLFRMDVFLHYSSIFLPVGMIFDLLIIALMTNVFLWIHMKFHISS